MSYSININDMQCVKPCLTMSSGCNFFWMNHITSPTAGVKISERSVDAIVKHHFSDGPPKHLPFVLFAFIPFKKFNIETEKVRGLCRVSPCEQSWAAIKACARDTQDDEKMRKWRNCFLSSPMCFLLDLQTRVAIHAFQLRENPLIDAEHVTWSTLQRIQMVSRERASLGGGPTTKQLVRHFAKITLAKSSESFTEGFIEAAMLTDKNIFNSKEQTALHILQDWDEQFGMFGPFNSVYKLEALIQKSKTPQNIVWVLRTIQDGLTVRTLVPGAITVNGLKMVTVPLALMKQSLLHELLYTYLDSKPFTSAARQMIRAKMKDHATVRSSISQDLVVTNDVDMSWGATQAESTMNMIQVIECMVYGDTYDTALKNAIKAGKGADVVISSYPSVTEDQHCKIFLSC